MTADPAHVQADAGGDRARAPPDEGEQQADQHQRDEGIRDRQRIGEMRERAAEQP